MQQESIGGGHQPLVLSLVYLGLKRRDEVANARRARRFDGGARGADLALVAHVAMPGTTQVRDCASVNTMVPSSPRTGAP